MSYPFRGPAADHAARRRPRGRSTKIDKQIGADNVAASSSSRSPARAASSCPADGLPARARRRARATTASCSSPTRSRPASAAPAHLFACEHEGVVPDLITTAKGIAGGLPLAGGDRPRRDHGRRRTPAASAAPTAATRSPAPPRSARSRRSRSTTSPRAARAHRASHAAAAARAADAATRSSATSAAAARCSPIELVEPGHPRARRRAAPPRSRRPATPRACSTLTCGTYGNVLRFLPPLVMPEDLLDDALDVLEEVALGLA